ncbi:hypothetical protein RHMOL_Rhmol01G0272500 [Rhododendron molle]|uniref:Uncharacterized protein n=1 Tax=Rhododendron molle TaxID=49168 RepID=A0ACC0Q823_RHOML|nr:hypothetical protein RHMOL_Rhmol01G0272500 [Rhododendron molle]
MLKGNNQGGLESGVKSVSLKLKPTGNEWLFSSVVAKLHSFMEVEELMRDLEKENIKESLVRSMGGRYILITFKTTEVRDAMIKGNCLQRWFSEIKPWKGDVAMAERFVWLNFIGMPLNVWNLDSFRKIGEKWGAFMKVDDSTLHCLSFTNGRVLVATEIMSTIDDSIQLHIDGILYKVMVREEPLAFGVEARSKSGQNTGVDKEVSDVSKSDGSFSSSELSPMESQVSETKGSFSDVELNVVQESGTHGENSLVSGEADARLIGDDPSPKVVKSVVGDPTNLVLEDGEIAAENINPLLIHDPVSDVGVFDNGFWNLSEVGFLNQVDVEMVDLNPTHVKSIDGIQLVVDLDPAEKTKEMGKGNWKHKSTEKMLGIPKFKKKVERKKKKCVVFRSAIAAAALSPLFLETLTGYTLTMQRLLGLLRKSWAKIIWVLMRKL